MKKVQSHEADLHPSAQQRQTQGCAQPVDIHILAGAGQVPALVPAVVCTQETDFQEPYLRIRAQRETERVHVQGTAFVADMGIGTLSPQA